MGKITINGETYEGNNITINNNKVMIDGREVTKKKSFFSKKRDIIKCGK